RKELGRNVVRALGEILDVNLFRMRGAKARILKTLVDFDVIKPLDRVLKIASLHEKVMDLKVKYERIDNFCNYRGHLGHEVHQCSFQLQDAME
ncbi:hypothetical protein PIB30_070000, partial [Stylosanthes scabra]|nr:hypothetical protein [Stylosanthes scabra]